MVLQIGVRSGDVELHKTTGTFRNAGAYDIYWSSRAAAYTSSTSATAYYLQVEPSAVKPSNGPNNRFNGFPLRCLDYAAVGADLLFIVSNCKLRTLAFL